MIGSLSRPMRLLVVASLALNVFLIGAVAADAVMHRGWFGMFGHGRPGIMGLPSPHELRAVLPENDEAILEQALQSHRAQFHEHLDALFAARAEVAAAVKAEPFDRAKLEAAFAALRERDAAIAAGAQDMLVDFISKLDAAGRARVAGLLAQRHKRPE
jgi:uncharacterized membrane protein